MNRPLDQIITFALMKLASEHSTYLIKELKQKPKHQFNVTISHLDNFIKEVEQQLSPTDLEQIEAINDAFHELIKEVKQQINEPNKITQKTTD